MTPEQFRARNDAYALMRIAVDKLYEANLQDEMQALRDIAESMRRKSQRENLEHINAKAPK